ncbi:hypothetical protein [Spiroplasma endosymbiont of Apeira syringaria]|uniref:hypothetical protein n=1 Tax=Spiroplasma endosymbiont of Apeira syringaria TaxID=3066307 RepID=UPI0030CFFBA2
MTSSILVNKSEGRVSEAIKSIKNTFDESKQILLTSDKNNLVTDVILKIMKAFLPLCTILILSHKCWENPIYGLLPTFLNQT